MSVEYIGKTYYVGTRNSRKSLDLSKLSIWDITEVKGLDELYDLEVLILNNNNISEIRGLDNLIQLKDLVLDKNDITEIRGLENLKNLELLCVKRNPVAKWAYKKFGILGYIGCVNGKAAVKYCQEIQRQVLIKKKERLEVSGKAAANRKLLHCPYCKKEISPDQNICSYCGVSVNE